LAGMTNCDTISGEGGLKDAIHPSAKHGAFWHFSKISYLALYEACGSLLF
jgi:hypothetical protein